MNEVEVEVEVEVDIPSLDCWLTQHSTDSTDLQQPSLVAFDHHHHHDLSHTFRNE